MVIARAKLFLRVGAPKVDPGWLHTEVTNKIHVQIKHLGPEIWNLLVPLPLFPGHVGPGDEPLFARIFPMSLSTHSAHHPIGIKCQVTNRVDPLFFCLEIFRHRRTMWSGQRCIPHQIEVRLGAAGDDGEPGRNAVSAFCLDIAQHGFAFKPIQALAHQHRYAMLGKILRQPRSQLRLNVAVEQM